jgi:hypothetical protein
MNRGFTFSAARGRVFFASLLLIISFIGSTDCIFGSEVMQLNWGLSTNSNIAYYSVFYGTQSFDYTNVLICPGPDTDYAIIENLELGTTYYFAVQATDVDGHNSDLTKEVSFVFPINLQTQIDYEQEPPEIFITSESVLSGSWEIESSTDLQTWMPGETPYAGLVVFHEPINFDAPQKFYRLRRL